MVLEPLGHCDVSMRIDLYLPTEPKRRVYSPVDRFRELGAGGGVRLKASQANINATLLEGELVKVL
jgi:hypothetical protein